MLCKNANFIDRSPKTILVKYGKALSEAHIPVDKMILFGSYAKNTPREGSDIDVCVVSSIFGQNSFDEMIMLAKIASKIAPLIEPHPYSPTDLMDPWDPLAKEIRTYGIPV